MGSQEGEKEHLEMLKKLRSQIYKDSGEKDVNLRRRLIVTSLATTLIAGPLFLGSVGYLSLFSKKLDKILKFYEDLDVIRESTFMKPDPFEGRYTRKDFVMLGKNKVELDTGRVVFEMYGENPKASLFYVCTDEDDIFHHLGTKDLFEERPFPFPFRRRSRKKDFVKAGMNFPQFGKRGNKRRDRRYLELQEDIFYILDTLVDKGVRVHGFSGLNLPDGTIEWKGKYPFLENNPYTKKLRNEGNFFRRKDIIVNDVLGREELPAEYLLKLLYRDEILTPNITDHKSHREAKKTHEEVSEIYSKMDRHHTLSPLYLFSRIDSERIKGEYEEWCNKIEALLGKMNRMVVDKALKGVENFYSSEGLGEGLHPAGSFVYQGTNGVSKRHIIQYGMDLNQAGNYINLSLIKPNRILESEMFAEEIRGLLNI